jgi:hypothetical protein
MLQVLSNASIAALAAQASPGHSANGSHAFHMPARAVRR